MSPTIIYITCGIVIALDALLLVRIIWVGRRMLELNYFDGDEHVVKRYLSFSEMMNKWWIWDIEKLRIDNEQN